MRQNSFTNSRSRASFVIIFGFAVCLFAMPPPSSAANLLTYYDFEGSDSAPFPVNVESHLPAIYNGFSTGVLTNFPWTSMSQQFGLSLNVPSGTFAPNLTGLGLSRSQSFSPADFDLPLPSVNGFQDMSVSFAVSNNGNGYAFYQGFYSTNSGVAFTSIGSPQAILATSGTILNFTVPAAANNTGSLVLRIEFSSGQSSGSALQTVIDNIQVNGIAAVPSAASVSVSGRVLTPDGRALSNAIVQLTDGSGNVRSSISSPFGYYRFEDVEAGSTYILGVASKRYGFAPRVVHVLDEIIDLDLIAEP